MSSDWKDAYRQQEQEHTGPVLYYTEKVIDHFTSPRNVGELESGQFDGFAVVGDPSCGDQMKLWIVVRDGIIADIRFKSYGCPGAIATSSMLTELARWQTVEEAKKITDDDVIAALDGIPENKKHCSLMGVAALRQAIGDYEQQTSCSDSEEP